MPRRLTDAWLALLLVLLAVTLVFLAVLQYRWIGAVSAAEEERSRSTLDLSARQFADELERHVGRIVNAFEGMQDEDQLTTRITGWNEGAPVPALIKTIYLAEPGMLRRFQPATRTLEPAELPPELAAVRGRGMPGPQRRGPLIDEIPAIVMPLRIPPPADRPPAGRLLSPEAPAFSPGGPRPGMGRPRPALLIAVIDREVLSRVLLPELTKRYFANDDEVVVTDPAGAIVYRSTPRWDGRQPDVQQPLLAVGPRGPSDELSRWRLRVRRGDALAASIGTARRRNLGISFAVLFVLGISVALLVLLLRRAESLRMRQMELVAGVTHELNTPLAALSSAGENLADGIVATPEQVARYGAMIVKEARRLTNMVGQVLDYAGLVSSRTAAGGQPVVVAELIEEACRFVDRIEVDKHLDDGLPDVKGDADALARAVQNLISNAAKYGDGKWVGIRAAAEKHGVAISVDDRGPGIDPHDLPHLFEPFFRGGATADRVRGSGLGLTLVRQIAMNHGGTVTVERRRGGGSSFTIHLPVDHA